MDLKRTLDRVKSAVAEAGAAIMEIYANPKRFDTQHKDDDSPLTAADLAANKILVARLQELTPDIPILSEESKQAPWHERKHWERCWVVDPLDGTKEFLKRNDEFTVNVALVRDQQPIMGVVYAPALQKWYFAARHEGAWRQEGQGVMDRIQVAEKPAGRPWRVVGSRSHNTPEVDAFVANLGDAEMVSMGSSLKLCLVADGTADVYPRLGPTSEWDTCAAQAIVEQAGGQVLNAESGGPLRYNTRESVLNPHFIVCARPDASWFSAP
ncbi:MAG: 3'(2'),5'-bisphosphate nucleotidase CysQ [Wenzhouxiangella sp.]